LVVHSAAFGRFNNAINAITNYSPIEGAPAIVNPIVNLKQALFDNLDTPAFETFLVSLAKKIDWLNSRYQQLINRKSDPNVSYKDQCVAYESALATLSAINALSEAVCGVTHDIDVDQKHAQIQQKLDAHEIDEIPANAAFSLLKSN
jgi:hypothetical protein